MSGPDQLFAKPRIRPRACLWVQMLILLVRPGSSDESPEGGVVDDHHAHARDEVRRGGVVWLAYATAGRHLIRLAVPAVAVFLPIGLLAASALILLVDGSAAVVNSDFELIGAPGTSLLVWSAATLVLSAAGQAVALPATVVLATGRLVGKGVSTSDAMRAAARRWPAMALLILVGVVAFAVALAAGFGILMWTGAQVTAYAVMAVLALSAMPCLLAVAPMVLEGRSARGALARAYWVTAGASWATPLTLAFGVVLFPALAEGGELGCVRATHRAGRGRLPAGAGHRAVPGDRDRPPVPAPPGYQGDDHRVREDRRRSAGEPATPGQARAGARGVAPARPAVRRSCADQPARLAGGLRDGRHGELATRPGLRGV
jgi:hypothetical protein